MAARRLSVVVDRGLSAGQQAVQAAHAVHDYAALHGPADATLVLLEGRDEGHLLELAARVAGAVTFREPDLGDRVTAVAFEGGREWTRRLRCALR